MWYRIRYTDGIRINVLSGKTYKKLKGHIDNSYSQT